jgi:hypothetical protein
MSANDTAHEHESFIKTPKQLVVVGVLALVIPVSLIIMLAQFVLSTAGKDTIGATSEATMARIKPVAEITLAAAGAEGTVRTGEEIVKGVCSACHATGAYPKHQLRGLHRPGVPRGRHGPDLGGQLQLDRR